MLSKKKTNKKKVTRKKKQPPITPEVVVPESALALMPLSKTNQKFPSLDKIKSSVIKELGGGLITTLASKRSVTYTYDDYVSWGSCSLNFICSQHPFYGIEFGRIIELVGWEACISGESYLRYEVWDKDANKLINCKGGTIARLYERFTGDTLVNNSRQGRHPLVATGVTYYVKSVDDEGKIIRNEVLDVVQTGRKKCYRMDTNKGKFLINTLDHKYLTPTGYKPLSKLSVGDKVMIHNNTHYKGRKQYAWRPDVTVKYHPNLPVKIVHDKQVNKDYIYYRGQKSRLVYEAFLNNMNYKEYISFLNTRSKTEIRELDFLPSSIHVHHVDEDFNNNELDNLVLIDPSEHGRVHALDHLKNLSFIAIEADITSIEEVGVIDTFDLKCKFPYNNYIANGIVVHNSGKTTACLHAVANAQRDGYPVAYIDMAHAIDLTYAKRLGVDADELLFAQPDYGEEALDIVLSLIKAGVKLIVVDDLASLTPLKIVESGMTKESMGLQARMMSQGLSKIQPLAGKHRCAILFINQFREKIGGGFGDKAVAKGGNAMKFYASLRLRCHISIAEKNAIKEGLTLLQVTTDKEKEEKLRIGSVMKVTCIKNKTAPPFQKCEVPIIFNQGIDFRKDMYEFAEKVELIKTGIKYTTLGTYGKILVKDAYTEDNLAKVWNLLDNYYRIV